MIFGYTAAVAVVIVHKKKNNKDDKPEYGAVALTAAATIAKEIKHNKTSFLYNISDFKNFILWYQSQHFTLLPESQHPKRRRKTSIKNRIPSFEPKRPQQLLLLNIT